MLCLALCACRHGEHSRLLAHDAYIWQKSWNGAVLTALNESGPFIQTWHVLAAEAGPNGQLTNIRIDRRALQRLAKPVVAVVRIDARRRPAPFSRVLALQIAALAADWTNNGVPLRGLEIDYDCAANRLAQYRAFLHLVRSQIARNLQLSITALPSWIGSPDLPQLLTEVDGAVLQVHSVMSPEKGLFSRTMAANWARAWSALSPVPFRLALPTYWSRVTWDGNGRIDAIESEVSRYGIGPAGRELFVEPAEVASLVAELERSPLPNLTGIAWFRLPTALDRRAWSLPTWRAVIEGQAPRAVLPVVRFQATRDGAHDVYLFNQSAFDVKLPSQVSISGTGCELSDALPPYNLDRRSGNLRFFLDDADFLPPGRQRLIGWVRCSSEKLNARVFF